MQKKIIALAIAGLASSAAFAQTNVTIYGVADAFVSWSNTNGGDRLNTQMATGGKEAHGRDTLNVGSGGLAGSRLGFRGTEDLGNGVKAVFVLEYGLNLTGNQGIGAGNPAHANQNTLATDDTANAMARQQYVGLQTGLGTLSFGRQYAPGYYSSVNDAQVWSVLSAKRNMQEFLNGTVNGNSNARWDNSINYLSPTMGGFSVQAIYQGGAQANEIAQRESFGIGLKYAAGPVVVEYGYHNSNGLPNAAGSAAAVAGFPSGVKTEEHYINTSFDAKVVKVFAAGQTIDQGNRMAAGVGNKGWGATAGVVVPAGKANIHLAYAYGDLNANTRSLNPSGTTVFQGQRDSLSAVVTYGMSKRTTLYGGAIYSDTDVRNAGGVVTTVAAGINHAF